MTEQFPKFEKEVNKEEIGEEKVDVLPEDIVGGIEETLKENSKELGPEVCEQLEMLQDEAEEIGGVMKKLSRGVIIKVSMGLLALSFVALSPKIAEAGSYHPRSYHRTYGHQPTYYQRASIPHRGTRAVRRSSTTQLGISWPSQEIRDRAWQRGWQRWQKEEGKRIEAERKRYGYDNTWLERKHSERAQRVRDMKKRAKERQERMKKWKQKHGR